MGISGLLPLLKEIQVSGNIADFKGKRLAVDAYVWLHRGAFGCAEDLVKGKRTTKFVDYAMYRVRMLRYHGITPFVVFDGGPLPAKRGTEESREKSRADSLARAQAFEAQGRRKEARDCYTKCVDITPEMAYQLIKALRAEGVTYVVAPYEADAQLCFLEREGFVDGIITEDSDLLVFGCKTVIFKLEKDGSCVSIDRSRLTSIRDLPMHQWTDTQFRRMAMLSGCDYLPSIPGIGLKKAHGMLRRYKSVEKSLQAIRLEGSHTIPPNYLEAFKQAELAFLYQRVFCPHRRCLVPLNPFPDEGLKEEDEKWIGSDVSNEVARGMAQGDLHPETRKPINDLWPDFQPCPKAGATASKTPAGKGPLDNWLTIRKRTTSAPTVRPVGGHTSGVTTLSNLNAATGVGRHRSEPTPPPSTVKVSKHFKSKAKEPTVPDTPKTQFSLHWEESDVVPTQVDRDQSRSPSPENIPSSPPVLVPSSPACDRIRSLSPEVSTARPSPSPAQTPLRVRSHFVKDEPFTSPFSHVSSPPAGTPPDSLDRALDAEYPDIDAVMSRTAPSSPTPSSSRVLIAASSQVASFGSTPCGNIFIHGSSQMATVASSPSATPLARTKMRSITSILVPASSPSLQAAPTVATKGSSSRGVSSDSIADDDIVTPAADSVPRRSLPGKRAREREVENSDPEAEARARVISQGWATRWSFDGQTSSSPAPAHGKRQAVATPLNSNGPLSTKKTVNASTAPTTSKPYTAGVDTPLGSSSRQQSKQPKHQPQPKSSLFSRPACKSAARPAAHAPAPQPHGMTVNALERFRYSRK